ncbi:MAG: RNA 2',3'-cyclic phosphodiesterase [Candidatus Hodarchaeales archaeon]|jgi:2'-5' RNA ligase
MTTLRLFIAVEIENKDLISKIQTFQQHLNVKGIRLTKLEQLHFTLHFLGDTPNERVDNIRDCLQQVDFKPFSLNLGGCGAFPNIKKPRVLWVGVKDGKETIISLQEQLGVYLSKQGFSLDKRRYSPHITLARVKARNKQTKAKLIRFLTDYEDFDVGITPVTRIYLKKSTLAPSGAIYDNLIIKELTNES